MSQFNFNTDSAQSSSSSSSSDSGFQKQIGELSEVFTKIAGEEQIEGTMPHITREKLTAFFRDNVSPNSCCFLVLCFLSLVLTS
jgi:hypothetical protein